MDSHKTQKSLLNGYEILCLSGGFHYPLIGLDQLSIMQAANFVEKNNWIKLSFNSVATFYKWSSFMSNNGALWHQKWSKLVQVSTKFSMQKSVLILMFVSIIL